MSERNMDPQSQRTNVPVRSAVQERASNNQSSPYQHGLQSHKNSLRGAKPGKKTLVVGAIIAVVALAGLLGASAMGLLPSAEERTIAQDKYQAVFLTNGQVYFGKINNIDENSLALGDIYYLQQQSQEPSEQKDAAAKADTTNTSLAKLGNELHGPEDAMYISKEQVLFWENLKTDGKVSKAISDYKKQ